MSQAILEILSVTAVVEFVVLIFVLGAVGKFLNDFWKMF